MHGPSRTRTCDRTTLLVLAGITACGAALRLAQIGAKPLWLDEAFSLWLAGQPLPGFLRQIVALDQHPPLYYLLLHLWMVGGRGASWVRMLSACVSVLNIPVIFLLGRRLDQRATGLMGAFVLALSPFHVRYAQEARMYALLSLGASLALWALVCLLTDRGATDTLIGSQFAHYLRTWRATRHPPAISLVATDLAWTGYIVFSAATVLTHNTGLLLPLAANVYVLALIWQRKRRPATQAGLQPPSLRNWIIAQAVLFLLWIPWLPAFAVQGMRVVREFWIQPPTLLTVLHAWLSLLMVSPPAQAGWTVWIATLFAGLVLLGTWYLRTRPDHKNLLHALWAIPFATELLVSLRRPIFSDRTLIWTTIPLCLLLATGLRQLRRRAIVVAATAVLAATNLVTVGGYLLYFEKERWDAAAAVVAHQAQPGDLILFSASWVQIPFDYYFGPLRVPAEERGIPVDLFDRQILEPKMAPSDLPRLRTLVTGHSRVWLVYSHHWYTDPEGLVPSTLQQILALQQRRELPGIEIYLFARSP